MPQSCTDCSDSGNSGDHTLLGLLLLVVIVFVLGWRSGRKSDGPTIHVRMDRKD